MSGDQPLPIFPTREHAKNRHPVVIDKESDLHSSFEADDAQALANISQLIENAETAVSAGKTAAVRRFSLLYEKLTEDNVLKLDQWRVVFFDTHP